MKSIYKLTKGELYKLLKSNTLYIMIGLLTVCILLMTWLYATQEKGVTKAVQLFTGNALQTDSFDIIDGKLDELEEMGIDVSQIQKFSQTVKDKPEIRMMLINVDPEIMKNLGSLLQGYGIDETAMNAFSENLGYADVQSLLYEEYFRKTYRSAKAQQQINNDILAYFRESDYNASFVDYIMTSLKDVFDKWEILFVKDGGLYKNYTDKAELDDADPQKVEAYRKLIEGVDNFYYSFELLKYLTYSSVISTNYLLMPTSTGGGFGLVSEEYSQLKSAIDSVSTKAKTALNTILTERENAYNENIFIKEFANLLLSSQGMPAMPINYTKPALTIPQKPAEDAQQTREVQRQQKVFDAYESLIAGLKELGSTDFEQNDKSLFYAYSKTKQAQALNALQSGEPIVETALKNYINMFNVSLDGDKLSFQKTLPFEQIINKSYTTVITKELYDKYFKPYYDDIEKSKIDSLADELKQEISKHSNAEIVFYSFMPETVATNKAEKLKEFDQSYIRLKSLFKEYVSRVSTIDSLVKNTNSKTSIEANKLDDSGAKKIQGFIFSSRYNLNSSITQAKFLIEQGTLSTNYTAPESLGKGYGAMAFIYILTNIIVLICGIVLSSGAIAGEHSDGTMKLLLIRPHTRTQVLISKFLSTAIVLLGLTIFNFLVTLAIGAIGWGLSGVPMALSIFNSKRAIILHPAVVMLFMHLFCYLEAVVFSLIALTISTLFRSRGGAIAVSMLIYFVSFVLGSILSTYSWYRFVIFNNTNLFQYMSSTGPAIADLTLGFSLVVTIFYCVILGILCFFTFAKRDAN